MSEARPSPRRFRFLDAMFLIAALAPGLVLLRVADRFALFDLGKMTESGNRPSTVARQFVEFLNVGGGCLLSGLVPAVLLLGLVRPTTTRREALAGPGLLACLVAVVSAVFPLVWVAGNAVLYGRFPEPPYSMLFNNGYGRWMLDTGPMILGAWFALWVLGRWRPRPTWTDRAGCVLGACFVLIYLYAKGTWLPSFRAIGTAPYLYLIA